MNVHLARCGNTCQPGRLPPPRTCLRNKLKEAKSLPAKREVKGRTKSTIVRRPSNNRFDRGRLHPIMGKLLKMLCFMAAVLVAGTAPRCVHAGYAAIVVDADSGTVLESIDATVPWYPASLTKVITV